jgi:hypothetical protein
MHTFIGDSPSRGQPGWHDGTQGLAHDRDHWYVTNTNSAKTRSILWRIPVSTDLAADVECDTGGVSCSFLTDLLLHSYNHYGDPDVFEFRDRTYVLVPLESDDAPAGVMIFRANETLDFLTFTFFPGQSGAPWVAVDGDGIIYSSSFDTQGDITRFYLDWFSFYDNEAVRPTLVRLEPILLQDETGAGFDLNKAQGGEFSDDGHRLYMSNGDGRNEAEPTEGLHVFAIQFAEGEQCGPSLGPCTIARQIERSHNSSDPGFAFEFHPGANLGATGQEPEGLTYWDLDAEDGVPGIRGQLHVVLLDNDSTDAEEVYVKHYTFLDIDTDPPVLTCPAPITAECVAPGGVPASHTQLRPFFAGVTATDVCTMSPLIDNNAPAVFALGTTPVTFTAADASGNASMCQAAVTVVDTTLPTISVKLSRSTLWPPNHKLVPVTASVAVADACGAPAFELVSITSSEPDDGAGDGHTSGDIQGAEFGTADTTFFLRAERSGASPEGRAYSIVYRVTDGSGNASLAIAIVRVPHSQ